jgi:hypothetical protein
MDITLEQIIPVEYFFPENSDTSKLIHVSADYQVKTVNFLKVTLQFLMIDFPSRYTNNVYDKGGPVRNF